MFRMFYFIIFLKFLGSESVLYDKYNGIQLNETDIAAYAKQNLTKQCTIEVKPCTPHEGRRVDGTCNNLKNTTRGSAFGPYLRLLEPEYGANGTIRTSKSGKPLPLARRVRTTLQSTGRVIDKLTFNMAAVHLAGFIAIDISAMNGIFLDLSVVYGTDDATLSQVREGKDGLLKMEMRDGRYVPLGDVGNDVCFQNTGNETICYRFGNSIFGNFDLRLATFTIFFMREHNRIAKVLKKINPCWRDDRLFKVARQINIATAANLYMYEFLPVIMGYKNMVNYGLISQQFGHVNEYNENTVPILYTEYVIASRYFHTFIDGRIKMYDEKYHYSGDLSISGTLFRLALIEEGNNFEEINRGTFFQQSSKIDDIQDPEISENFYGGIEKAHDLPSIDIQRGRDLGIRGYSDYRKLCGLKPAKTFDDLQDVIDVEKVDALKNLYENVSDVDLLAGIMSETHISGTFVGPTLFCIMAKQLQLMRQADRFWFERGNQPHSFTLSQLMEIRKANMARFACDNAEGVKFMQPNGMLNVGPGNEPVPCTHILGPDLSKWQDDSCQKQKQSLDIKKQANSYVNNPLF